MSQIAIYDSEPGGPPPPTVRGGGGGGGGSTPPPVITSDECTDDIGSLSATATRNGSWSSDCQSSVSGRGYARYYTFTLSSETDVTINLESSVDTYLYLRSGSVTSGSAQHENDDIVSWNTNSQIVATLSAGSWTIETTTYSEDTQEVSPFLLADKVARRKARFHRVRSDGGGVAPYCHADRRWGCIRQLDVNGAEEGLTQILMEMASSSLVGPKRVCDKVGIRLVSAF